MSIREAAQRLSRIVRETLRTPAESLRDEPWSIGAVTSLTDARFSRTAGVLGGLEPNAFLMKHGAGIFFLEPFAKHKQPLLLLHGYCGYPQELGLLIRKLTREPRFCAEHQIWLAQYPSGQHPELTANALGETLLRAQQEYGFSGLNIVAHSMGGLVARAMLQQQMRDAKIVPWIRSCTTIATPFDGVKSAGFGARYSPFVVPAWTALDPQSLFLRELFSPALPAAFPRALITSRRRKQAGDGVVRESSQLRREAVLESQHLLRLETSHVGAIGHDRTAELILKNLE